MTAIAATTRRYIGYPAKRLLDVLLAASLLIVLSPLLLCLALAIRLSSPGPIFYRQWRLGLHEQPFQILKFRSMRADADRIGPPVTAQNDSRVTAVGRILRRTSLDELPQLVNVLRGEMSLIGPRPYVGFELEDWAPDNRSLRASVRPGISGLAQAAGRSSLTAEQGAAYDLEYVRGCSFGLDCAILLRTVIAVLTTRGSN